MEGKIKCLVCGKYEFESWSDMGIYDVCDWCNDAIQNERPDYLGGANRMCLNETRQAYKEGNKYDNRNRRERGGFLMRIFEEASA